MDQERKLERIVIVSYDAMNIRIAESKINEGNTHNGMVSGRTISAEQILETWIPHNPESVAIRITLGLGWIKSDASDFFDICIITNNLRDFWESNQKSLPATARVSTLYCQYYDWPTVEARIVKILQECESSTQKESWHKLRKHFDWEYEGMASAY